MAFKKYLFFIVILIPMSCGELFFPKTGTPTLLSSSRRSTPEGVIGQLIEAYETRRIELIEEILADSFQFYIASTFDDYLEYNSESPDTSLLYIESRAYHYWKRKDELYRTKKIFEHTISSGFYEQPYISNQHVMLSAKGDTIGVELKVINGALYLETDTYGLQCVDVNNQVFLLRRDSEGLWVIRKWYDLSTKPSTI
jgi:hypothetical protein